MTAPVVVYGLPAEYEHVYSGKVRDLFSTPDDRLLFIASDRISAYDWVLPTLIPDKGKILTQLSLWWFEQLADIVPSHVSRASAPASVRERAMVCERLDMFPVECVVRGYLADLRGFAPDNMADGFPTKPLALPAVGWLSVLLPELSRLKPHRAWRKRGDERQKKQRRQDTAKVKRLAGAGRDCDGAVAEGASRQQRAGGVSGTAWRRGICNGAQVAAERCGAGKTAFMKPCHRTGGFFGKAPGQPGATCRLQGEGRRLAERPAHAEAALRPVGG